jgi:hypothetical protein
MKKLTIPAFFAAIVLFLTAAKPFRQQDDAEKVKTVLNEFFDSINTHDIGQLKGAVTSDFVLYEDGRLWSVDSAAMNIKRNIPFSVKYQLSNLKIFVDTKSADATYTNHGDFTFAAGSLSLDWVESATFRKVNGEWKINFLSATIRK